MARVLAYTSPARGHLYPLVPILDELQARGHRIAVRTLPSELAALRERGFTADPIAEPILAIEHDDWQARTQLAALRRSLATFVRRAEHEPGDLHAAIEAERPDLLLVDTTTWGAAAVAEALGRPWAQWLPYPAPVPSRDAPPFGPGFAPASGPLARIRDRVLGPVLLRGYGRALLPAVNGVRAAVELEPLGAAAETFTRADVMLYMSAEPFEYPRSDWPGTFRLIGPTTWDPPVATPDWLAELDDPLVLVSTSSEFQDDGRLVASALAALRDAAVSVVATTPSADTGRIDVPANARVERFVPHAPLLQRAACVVCHGGMGIAQKALAAGVPVCVVPFGRDQLEVARRVEVAGAGTRLPARRLDARRLRAAVEAAMEMGGGARRVQAGFAAAGGARAAADELAALVRAPRARRSPGWRNDRPEQALSETATRRQQ
jgi:MGT family glycosyltransferase